MVKLLSIVCFILIFISCLSAQDIKDCASLKYEDKNQLTPSQLTVKKVSGQLVVEGDENYPFIDICIALFDEKNKKFIFIKEISEMSENGKFNIKKIPNGKYRLIVKTLSNFFCVANVPIEINNTISKNRKISIIMRPSGLDDCSFGKYENKRLDRDKKIKCSKQ